MAVSICGRAVPRPSAGSRSALRRWSPILIVLQVPATAAVSMLGLPAFIAVLAWTCYLQATCDPAARRGARHQHRADLRRALRTHRGHRPPSGRHPRDRLGQEDRRVGAAELRPTRTSRRTVARRRRGAHALGDRTVSTQPSGSGSRLDSRSGGPVAAGRSSRRSAPCRSPSARSPPCGRCGVWGSARRCERRGGVSPAGSPHQRRARHSARCGRSAPRVVPSP